MQPILSGCAFGSVAAVVLLSGGMDSTACAVWAARAYRRERILAIGIRYGQTNADAELVAAHKLATRLGIEWQTAQPCGAIPRAAHMAQTTHDPAREGPSPAIVPGRNATFLAIAAGLGAARFPGCALDLWIGSSADDQGGFPDCSPAFLDAQAHALSLAHGNAIRIVAPLVATSKRQLVADADPELLAEIRQSFSCYRGTACGECTPCVLRAAAFAGIGETDAQPLPKLCGGDPHRERAA